MVISSIKLGFAQKKVADLPRKFSISVQDNSVKKVCIILDEADAGLMNKFKNLREDLKIKEEDFKLLLCLSHRPKSRDLEGTFFSSADLTWSGKIKNPDVKDLLKKPFDLLISFTGKDTKTANYIASAIDAGLKVNRREEAASGFDLTIATGFEEVDVFITELKKYLKILNRIRE